jgi:hypothetical protein
LLCRTAFDHDGEAQAASVTKIWNYKIIAGENVMDAVKAL